MTASAKKKQSSWWLGTLLLLGLPVVVAARVGRMWGVFRPIQNVNFDILFERRGLWPSRAGRAMYAVLLPLSGSV